MLFKILNDKGGTQSEQLSFKQEVAHNNLHLIDSQSSLRQDEKRDFQQQ
jgi:hypothetical protein